MQLARKACSNLMPLVSNVASLFQARSLGIRSYTSYLARVAAYDDDGLFLAFVVLMFQNRLTVHVQRSAYNVRANHNDSSDAIRAQRSAYAVHNDCEAYVPSIQPRASTIRRLGIPSYQHLASTIPMSLQVPMFSQLHRSRMPHVPRTVTALTYAGCQLLA